MNVHCSSKQLDKRWGALLAMVEEHITYLVKIYTRKTVVVIVVVVVIIMIIIIIISLSLKN